MKLHLIHLRLEIFLTFSEGLGNFQKHWPYKKTCIWGRNNISFKKDTDKEVLLQVKDLVQLFVFRAAKTFSTFLSSTSSHSNPHPFEGPKILSMKMMVQQYSEKEQIESLYDFWKKMLWGVRFFTVMHARTKSLKKDCIPEFPILLAFRLPLCGLLAFIYNTCHCTKN